MDEPTRSAQNRGRYRCRPVLGLIATLTLGLIAPLPAPASAAPAARIEDAAIAALIDNLSPSQTGTTFSARVGKIYCFTRVTGAQDGEIKHLWFQGDFMVMEVTLPVKSANFRTYSVKTITDASIGQWHVDVTTADGTVLASLPFSIE